jgi:DNA-binding HxlR family transcriptional regulator
MVGARNYDDPCGTARALDIIGERWSLLVVRELLFGPKRFGTLRDGLHGVSPNVLSQRLRDLEKAGIVQREMLPPPAGVAVYSLTAPGRALEPVLIELGRWGSNAAITSRHHLGVDAFALALKTTFVGSAHDATFALAIGGQWFTLSVSAGAICVTRGRPASSDATVEGSVEALRSYAFGRETLEDLEADGRITVAGNRRVARRLPRMFRVADLRPT